MSYLKSLKAARTLDDVALLLGYKPASLSYLLYIKPESEKYRKFEIPKKSGGVRHISAPSVELMLLQRKLADFLQNCLLEINEANGYSDDSETRDRISHGFKRNRSILTNALQHRNRNFVFNLDIKDFFGSINFGRVRGFLISDRNFQLTPKVATVIAQIICFENSLPQGSPCSPVVSNLIGHILDTHLVRLAYRVGCTYSRYADDLTFSTNKKEFPEEVARCITLEGHEWVPGVELERLVKRSGFSINAGKTRMQYHDSRQEVTGLVVNKKINVPSDYRHCVRAMVHRLITKGEFDFERLVEDDGVLKIKRTPGKLMQLHGMLGFIDWIDRSNKIRLHENTKEISSKERIYRRFLLYKEFYAAPRPVLICEGKSDSVYITHAIRSLANQYPDLASIDSSGKISINIRRFRYTETSTGRILGLNGGYGDLKNLLLSYHQEASKFSAPGMQSPIIVLVDNDSGGRPVFTTAKQILGKDTDMAAPFTHVTKNLYLMATPTPNGAKESEIEDLFDSYTRGIKIGTKTFASKKPDPILNYCKADFAYKVVKHHADKIDFTGFKPLLDRFCSVIAHHKAHTIPFSSTQGKNTAP